MASIVFVWENNTAGHCKVQGKTWSGHASMNIGDDFSGLKNGNIQGTYVSWWPKKRAKFEVGEVIKAAFKFKKKGTTNLDFVLDCHSEGFLPDHIISIPTTGGQEERMMSAWMQVYHVNEEKYSNLRNNCSTIVSRVLHAAGIGAEKWSENHHSFWTPACIRILARSAKGTFLSWKKFNELQKETSGADFARYVYDPQGRGLVHVDEARSGYYCSTGVPCKFQRDQRFTDDESIVLQRSLSEFGQSSLREFAF